jgi:hypothetical protein
VHALHEIIDLTILLFPSCVLESDDLGFGFGLRWLGVDASKGWFPGCVTRRRGQASPLVLPGVCSSRVALVLIEPSLACAL